MTASIPQSNFDPLRKQWLGVRGPNPFETPATPEVVPAPPAPQSVAVVSVAPVVDAPYKVTDQNLVVNNGGGHRTHYSIWTDANGTEYIYIAGVQLTKITDLIFNNATRETVVRR